VKALAIANQASRKITCLIEKLKAEAAAAFNAASVSNSCELFITLTPVANALN
jgi:hypothetical protein